MLGFDVTDDRLSYIAALHLATSRCGNAAHLAGDPNPELLWVVVATVHLVDVDATGVYAGQLLDLGGIDLPRLRSALAGGRRGREPVDARGPLTQTDCIGHQ